MWRSTMNISRVFGRSVSVICIHWLFFGRDDRAYDLFERIITIHIINSVETTFCYHNYNHALAKIKT